jgi:hypothetical protein
MNSGQPVSIRAAAFYADVSVSTIYRHIKHGLHGVKLEYFVDKDGELRTSLAAIERFNVRVYGQNVNRGPVQLEFDFDAAERNGARRRKEEGTWAS